MFFKFKKDLFETLDKLLDNSEFKLEQSIKSIRRAKELSLNDGKMIKILNEKLRA
jgi:hypothetical protein